MKRGISNDKHQSFDRGERVRPVTECLWRKPGTVSRFPHDDRILYTYDGGGNELNHIVVREIDGSNRDLTPGDDLKAGFLNWSGDGESIYLTSTERNQQSFDIYRYSAEDFSRELVFESPGFRVSKISGDGRWVALDRPRTSADLDIYLVDVENSDKSPVLITKHGGNIFYRTYGFSPDGKSLDYATNEYGEFNQAWTHDLETGEKASLIDAAWDVSFVAYSRGGRFRVSGINADARTEVTFTDLKSGEAVSLPPLPQGELRNIRFSADESQVALIVNADNSPSNIHVIDLKDGNTRQPTEALNPEIDQSHLVVSEVIRYKSFDGLEIPSILYNPHGASAENPVP